MRGYPEYKDTGFEWLGEIPAHWGIGKLGGCFEERNEKVSDEDYAPLSVTKNGIVPQMEHVAKTDAGDNRKKVCVNDFVINSRSDRKGSSGTSQYDGSVSLISTVLKPREYLPEFAHHLFRSYNFQEEFYRFGKGIVADLWSTRYAEMKSITVPLIPKEEQKVIASYLDRETARIDNLIAEKQNFINLLKEKRQALISHVVTKGLDPNVKMKDSGIEWIGEVPEHWVSTRLKFHVSRIIDTEHKTIPFVDYSDFLVVRTSDIREGELLPEQCKRTDSESFIEWTRRGVPSPGDIIFTREAPAGEACIVPEGLNVCLGQRTVLIRTSQDLLAEFLLLVIYSDLTKEFIDDASLGSTVKHLNMADIPNIPIFLPDISNQQQIVDFASKELSKINDVRSETLNTIELLQEHRTALISAAVTGKIDVRNQV